MSFLEKILRKKKRAESVVLIDIGADAIAGAYARYADGEIPSILYTQYLPIEIHEGESHERAMLRTLQTLGTALIRTGAPILARATGSGTARMVVVSVDAPWQETSVRTENLDQEKPFVFTKSLVTNTLEKKSDATPEKTIADESIIGTILNGYETNNPYGREVHRASIIVLSSLIHRAVAGGIVASIRGLFHTKDILPIAGSSLRYQAMRTLFPHERDAIILDATGGSLVSAALVRKGILVTILQTASAVGSQDWITAVTTELTEIAKEYPLPRTIFLLARESEIETLHHTLETINFSSLWLSDNPPTIVPVLASHVIGSIRHVATESPNIILLLMAQYYQHCSRNSTRSNAQP